MSKGKEPEEQTPFERFREAMRKLVSVPKEEVNVQLNQLRQDRKAQNKE